MWQAILNSVQSNGLSLITMGGKISPYLGAVIALAIGIFLIYAMNRAKKEKFQDDKKQGGEVISDETSKSQDTAKKVGDAGDDFLDGDGKKK